MKIPSALVAGDSISWADDATIDHARRSITSTDWTLTYAIRGASTLNLVATSSGSGWLTEITATQSAGLSAGVYYWAAHASRGSERITLGQGRIEVTDNLATATDGYDGRTQSRKDLDAVQAAIRAMVSGGAVQRYAIAGRQVEKMSMTDLLLIESRLKAQVVREEKAQKIANGLGNPHSLHVRFRK